MKAAKLWMLLFACLLLGALVAPAIGPAEAGDAYKVNVRRVAKDFYTVSGGRIAVMTGYCYEYAYGDEAILTRSMLVFLSSGESCQVRRVLGKFTLKPGTYKIRISREADNLYSVMGRDSFIQTSMCLSLALGTEAILDVTRYGGQLIILDFMDQRCQITALWEPTSI